jgi:N-acetylmuramoyl-L-alanine amidase
MMRRVTLAFLVLIIGVASVRGAGIVLVYPRTAEDSKPVSYSSALDSTFVLGRIEPPTADLFINQVSVPVTAQGAFLAWLPLRKSPGDLAWECTLKSNGAEIAALRFPYEIESTVPTVPVDTFRAGFFPRVVTVRKEHAHTLTTRGGAYDLFPEVGCRLIATGHQDGAYRFGFGDGLWGEIEDQFVGIGPDTTLPIAILGDGICGRDSLGSICGFSVNRSVMWHAQLENDGRALRLILPGVKAGLNRIRYDVKDDFVRGMSWSQSPEALTLDLVYSSPITRGFSVQCSEDRLSVRVRSPMARSEKCLKGKVIVLDPGHGGTSTGAIGPLGTQEKDVSLLLAKTLKRDLEHKGARVRMTRDSDADLGLYERTDFARAANADFFLSLHCNALPDSLNPRVRHGSGTYYHQSMSRRAAEIVHRHLLKTTSLRDDGLYDADFAVVRGSEYPAVLVEVAYLIYPQEETLLQSNDFLRRTSRGLLDALGEYFRTEP